MFRVGNRVAVLDDALEGIIVSIENGVIGIETTEGFSLEFEAKELVRIGKPHSILSDDSISLSEIIREKESFKKPTSKRVKPKERNLPPMEVDLHIEKLVPSKKYMSNFDILNLQMETAKRQLEFAIQRRIQKVVFIHGVGEGVLKAELDFMFGRYDNIKFYDADYSKYGLGATEIYIFQNT